MKFQWSNTDDENETMLLWKNESWLSYPNMASMGFQIVNQSMQKVETR